MNPLSNKRGMMYAMLAFLLNMKKTEGMVMTKCAIQTDKGIRVADVVWCSKAFYEENKLDTPYLKAPELCIEIKLPARSFAESLRDKALYFAKGASEVWLCDEDGAMTMFDNVSEIAQSMLFPDFPGKIDRESLPS